ncbi:MAG: PP2C family protein-serine/threonine phosphatase [Desulfobacteraceae bacterium]|nr:PP2C family protein-serine/threonine phosphatase [Desulfobacteraceae bacterium]
MKIFEHVKCFCSFWRPTVARRITLYFLIFGLIIFTVTSIFYMISGKKHFVNTTSRAIHHQFSLLEGSSQPDFIGQSIGQSRPDLRRLMEMLVNISSSFYLASDISIYSKPVDGTTWSRLYFSDSPILHVEPVADAFTPRLDDWLQRRFHRSDARVIRAGGPISLFVDISGGEDVNTYFLKIGLASEGFTGFMKGQIQHFIVFFLIALVLLRILGYYFARKIAGPIENLSKISAQVARGDLSKSVPVTSNDEIGVLSKNFNQMVEGLREWDRIKMVEFELEKGQKIQREFLPTTIPNFPDWNIATCFFPAGKVSGDFYDVFKFSDGNVGLVIADVCDKGVGSALYMALFRSLIRVFADQAAFSDPTAISGIDHSSSRITAAPSSDNKEVIRLRAVPLTNNYIAQTHGDEGMFATLFFGVLNPETGQLYYINAGHEPLYLIDSKGVKKALDPTGPAVGMFPNSAYDVGQIHFEQGDMLIGYTDGVTEARSPEDELFTRGRLKTLVEQPFNSATEMLDRIKTNLFEFIDIAPRGDDVTMLAVQRIEVA